MAHDQKKRPNPKQPQLPAKGNPMDKFNEAMRKILSVPKKDLNKK